MKKVYVIILCAISLMACKKEILTEPQQITNVAQIAAKQFLKKELTTTEFSQLDWTNAKDDKIRETGYVVLLKDPNDPNKFLIAASLQGKWTANYVYTNLDQTRLSGEYIIQRLNKASTSLITFKNGKLISKNSEAVKSVKTNGTKVLLDGGDLPPVTVSATRYLTNQTIDLHSLYWLMNEDPTYLNIYVDFGSSAEYYSNGDGIAYDIDFDPTMDQEAVNVNQLINCFGSVPDNSSTTYSVKLCADIPVNGKPNILVNLTLSPGHAFIILTKTNGANSVTKCFGFYPQSGPLSLTTFGVPSTVKNDTEHEYNASLTMPNITKGQFDAMTTEAVVSAGSQTYDINSFNCVDYALGIFNLARSGNEITVPTNPTTGGKIPGGLYNTLHTKMNSGSPEAGNITTGKFKAPVSSGGCP